MFTEYTYKSLRTYFLTTTYLINSPFKYDPRLRQFSEISRLSRLWYNIMLCWCFLRTFWQIFLMVASFFWGFPSVADTALEVAFILFNVTVLCMHIIEGILYRQILMDFQNKLLNTNAMLKEHFLVQDSNRILGDGCGIYIRLFTPAAFNLALTIGLFFLIQPHSRMYFYSWLPVEKSMLTLICYSWWECYSNCWQMGIFFTTWFTKLLFANGCCFWLQEIW